MNLSNLIQLLFTIAITALTAYTAHLPNSGKKIIDDTSEKFTSTGKKFNRSLIVLAILSYMQIVFNLYESERKEKIAKVEGEKRDSILKAQNKLALIEMKKKYDSTNIKTILSITNTLGTYGFKFDSVTSRLVRIVRDSSKTKIIEAKTPTLSMCLDENGFDGINYDNTIKDRDNYKISFCSYNAGSTNYHINAFVIIKDSTSNKYYLISKPEMLLNTDEQIPEDQSRIVGFNVPLGLPYKELYVYVKGTYSNLDRSKSNLKINTLYYYNRKSKYTSYLRAESRERILKYLKIDSTL